MRWQSSWETTNSPQDLWGSAFPGPTMWTKMSHSYQFTHQRWLKGRHFNETALQEFSVSTLLTMSCSSFKTSTSLAFALSTKASLKSQKRTKQESLGVTPFSLFSSRDAAFSSRSQITREISAKNPPPHTDAMNFTHLRQEKSSITAAQVQDLIRR